MGFKDLEFEFELDLMIGVMGLELEYEMCLCDVYHVGLLPVSSHGLDQVQSYNG